MRSGDASSSTSERSLVALWWALLVIPAVVQIALSTVVAEAGVAPSPLGLFWLVLIAALLKEVG